LPGICGVIDATSENLASALKGMVGSLRHFDWHTSVAEVLGDAGLGQVLANRPGSERAPQLGRAGDLVVAFDGELYGKSWLAEAATLPDRVARAIEERGVEFLAASHGSFACAVWDRTTRQLQLITDQFGTRPLYWTLTRGRLLFASEIKALHAHSGATAEFGEEGLAQFLAFGQYLGNTTLYRGVEVVPAARVLTFSLETGSISIGDPPPRESVTAQTDRDWLALIESRLVDAVTESCGGDERLGLSLSGGLDARSILAVVPAGRRVQCVSLGIPGSLDHRAAGKLAALAGQPHHRHMLAGDFLQQFEPLLDEVVRLTDGQYLDQGIVLTTLPTYRDLGVDVLLRGHAGELMHMSKAYAFSLDDKALTIATRAELTDWLWRHLTGYMIGSVSDSFFRGSFGSRMRDMARAALEQQLAAWDDVEPVPQRIWRLFVAERLRRETVLSLQLFRNYVEVRVPLLEPRLISALLAAPTHLKVGETIQAFVLGHRRPDFLRVVNANTGAPVGSSRARVAASHFKLRVFAKLGVPGYQPYERLGAWLAQDLQPWLRRLLVTDSSAVPIEPAAWQAVIDQHASRERNHTFLLMAGATLALHAGQAARAGRTIAVSAS